LVAGNWLLRPVLTREQVNQERKKSMSKNMTRKGLALGLGTALVASTFGIAPAYAAGQDDKTFVSLSPRVGTEYTVLLDQYFDLKSNTVDSLAGTSGRDLKFLVSDPQALVFVDQSQSTATPAEYSEAVGATNDLVSAIGDGTTTTITVATDALVSGEKLFLYNFSDATAATALNGKVATQATATTATFAAATNATLTATAGKAESSIGLSSRALILTNAGIDADLFESATVTSQPGKTTTNGRASDGTFVINTETNANANDRLLRLVTNATGTYSVTVTAWVDSNDNGLIDSTEYTSPARTITFQDPEDVTAVTTLSPVVGDATLVAKITTTPVLNGQQVIAQNGDFLNAKFTRSLSTSNVYSAIDLAGNTQSSAWNDVTKTWTVTVSVDADAANEASAPDGTAAADAWAGVAAPVAADTDTIAISTSGVVTVVTNVDHKLSTGDKITMANATAAIVLSAETGARTVTVTGARSFTYTVSETTGLPTTAIAATAAAQGDEYTLATYTGPVGLVDRVGAETYTAQAVIQTGASTWTAISAVAETGVTAAATASAEVSTAATTAIQGKTYDDASGTNAAEVLTGTKSVPVTFTALDADGDALAAGRPVVVTLSGSGTADTYRVNGKTTDTVLTDANGQATVTITAVNGYNDADLRVQGVIENAATVYIDLQWRNASFGLVDLANTAASVSTTEARTIQALGSYTMNLAVLDQFYNAPAAGVYRLKLTNEGVPASFVSLVDGRATVTVTDTGVFGPTVVTDIALEKLSGTTVTATTSYQITADVVKTFKVVLGADGSTLYGTAADLSDKVAEKALVELDKRVQSGSTPAYANDVLVNGRVMNSATSAGKQGALVTISGPSNVLFEVGEKAARGTLTFLSGANGNFEVKAYSTTAQKDTVVTVTSNGASATTKVSFTGTGVGEGTSLVVTAPAAVKPASTFQVKAKLTDAYGNNVDTAAGRVKVTYTGPGIIFGTLPTETDANGELQFSVLLGANDTGSVSVTVSYDQNGDGDYVDAKDLNTSATIAINATGTVAAAGKVNVGSFNGKLVVYALGLDGAKISWKVAGKWGTAVADGDALNRFDRPVGASGVNVIVEIYVNGAKQLTKTVLTK
jgi:trimeric autotransporter adhesin